VSDEPESFSPASARLAAEEVLNSLSRNKKIEFFGNFNEIFIVLARLTRLANVDENKEIR
jgi:hypothetical protein